MEITETQTTVKRLGGLPLLGDGVDLLGAETYLIETNWEGYACRIRSNSVDQLELSEFETRNKFAAPIYGVNSIGCVIFAIGKFDSDDDGDILEREDHFYVKKCDSVNPYMELWK